MHVHCTHKTSKQRTLKVQITWNIYWSCQIKHNNKFNNYINKSSLIILLLLLIHLNRFFFVENQSVEKRNKGQWRPIPDMQKCKGLQLESITSKIGQIDRPLGTDAVAFFVFWEVIPASTFLHCCDQISSLIWIGCIYWVWNNFPTVQRKAVYIEQLSVAKYQSAKVKYAKSIVVILHHTLWYEITVTFIEFASKTLWKISFVIYHLSA